MTILPGGGGGARRAGFSDPAVQAAEGVAAVEPAAHPAQSRRLQEALRAAATGDFNLTTASLPIDFRIVPSSFPNPGAELACVTRPWSVVECTAGGVTTGWWATV